MNTVSEEIMKIIGPYVTRTVMAINTILLLCHIGFGVVFELYDAEIIFYYNILSIIIYIMNFAILYKRRFVTYTTIVYLEILLFMIVAVICVGWDFGFQQWSMAFVTATVFVDFLTNRNHKMRKITFMLVALDVLVYAFLRIWTYQYPYIYEVNNKVLLNAFFNANSMIGFAFLIILSFVYTNTVFKLEKTLLDMANNDPLTGLRNRRRMHELLKKVPEERVNNQYEMCIAMMDVDHFKSVNDTYGHDVGDEVLKVMANILLEQHEKKEHFHVCRWGGEEFLVLYRRYGKSQDEIVDEFNELRERIEDTVIKCGEHKIKVTVTMGLSFCKNGIAVDDMIKEADDNLYKGKERGRNRVVS